MSDPPRERRVLLALVSACLWLAACGSDSAATGDTGAVASSGVTATSEPTPDSTPLEGPTTTEGPNTTHEPSTTEEPTVTTPNASGEDGATLTGEAFVLAEQQYFGQVGQDLITTVARLAEDLPVRVAPADLAEDKRGGTAVVFSLPLARISEDVDGYYVLSVSTPGAEAIEITAASWEIGQSSATLILETRPGGPLEASWGYSLRPRMRPVFLADADGSLGVDTAVFHTADFGPGPVGADQISGEELADGTVRSTFTTPLWLIDQTPLAEACELVLDELGERAGAMDLQLPLAALDDKLLDDAAVAVERLLPAGQQLNLVVDVNGREQVRGKRLQPLVRYPVTMLDDGQNPTAATIGCSVSLS